MASNNIYGTCLRSLRSRQPRIHPATISLRTSAPSRPASIRHFAASLRRSAGLAQESKPQNEEKLEPRPDPQDSAVLRIAKQLRKHAAAQTETYVAYGGTKALFSECGKHATYTIPQASEKDVEIPKTAEGEDIGVGGGWWHDELGLPPTFSTWAQVTFLHMYLLTTRLRHFPEDVAPKWHQHLTDHFFARAEELMITHHSIHSGSIRSRYLKDLFSQWRGVIASYDEGILKGDATLAAAIWRNAFKGRDDADAKSLAQIVGWMRRELVRLQETDDADVASANWTFESPKEEARAVMIESRLMKEGVEGESSA